MCGGPQSPVLPRKGHRPSPRVLIYLTSVAAFGCSNNPETKSHSRVNARAGTVPGPPWRIRTTSGPAPNEGEQTSLLATPIRYCDTRPILAGLLQRITERFHPDQQPMNFVRIEGHVDPNRLCHVPAVNEH